MKRNVFIRHCIRQTIAFVKTFLVKTSYFQQGNQCAISDDEIGVCVGLLTARESLESLKNMESKKTPGTDGTPVKFYKVFWNDQPFFLASIIASHAKGLLSISQRRGLLTLIPEKDKSVCYIINWRPISLLNCDYKLAAKSVANRIKGTLPLVINSDETGFQNNQVYWRIYIVVK